MGNQDGANGSVPMGPDQPPQSAAGPWPGFGTGTTDVGGTTSNGVSAFAARVDHAHKGVHSVNGLFGDVTIAGVSKVATFAALAALSAATLTDGAQAYVVSARATFVLMASTIAARSNIRVAASGLANYQWVRYVVRNPYWEVQATWSIDPTNSTGVASDDNSGLNSGAPLLTFTEHSMRLAHAELGQAVTSTILASQQAGDTPNYTYRCLASNVHTFLGSATVLHSGTLTGAASASIGAIAAADDYQIIDAAVSGGSWTAAGALAKGVRIKRTNGTVVYAYALKDLGGNALRISQPINIASTLTMPQFAIADAYNIESLPQIISFRMDDGQGLGTKFQDVDWRATGRAYGSYQHTNVYFSTITNQVFSLGVNVLVNCCFDTGGSTLQGIGQWTLSGGAFKGTGATLYNFTAGVLNAEANILCFQGARLDFATFVNTNQINFYDTTSPALNGDTGGHMHMTNGGIGGKGNTSVLASMRQGSQLLNGAFGWTSGAAFNTASTSSGTPLQCDGTGGGVVAIPLTSGFNMIGSTS